MNATKPKETKHFEIKAYDHEGIRVFVEIDYDAETISLVEREQRSRFKMKQWVFSGRTIGYMQGWQNILDAMKVAIECARIDLQKHLDAKEREKIQLVRAAQASMDQEDEDFTGRKPPRRNKKGVR